MSQLSPEMNNFGLLSVPNLKSSLASSISLKYLLSFRASSGFQKDSLRQSSATYLRPLSWQIMWTVDLYLLMLVQSSDQSFTRATSYFLSEVGLKATNCPLSVRAQYLPWSGRASVKKDPEGGRNSLSKTALVAFSMRLQTLNAEFHAMNKIPNPCDSLQ